jgi:hypothetical protein
MSVTRNFHHYLCAGALLLTSVAAGPAMGALIIDGVGFPNPAVALTSTGVTSHLNAPSDLGYLRDTSLTTGAGSYLAATVGGGSIVEVTVLDSGNGGTLSLAYDGATENLAPSGETILAIDFLSVDTRTELGGSINVTATANGGSATVPLATSPTPTTVFIPFASFVPSPDFTNISTLNLDFSFSGALTNLAIDRIYTMGSGGNIPEPTSLVMLGLAAAGLVVGRRSR